MAAHRKQTQQLARQFLQLSLVDGAVSPERVAGVLEYIEKHRPPHALHVLRAYHRLVSTEIAKSRAVVEHAGAISPDILGSIEAAMSQRYSRKITASAQPSSGLIAGLRVRVGDDVYESSIAGQLQALAAAV
jgi:F-type H+-transporting ATPase subunit delta